MDPRVENFLINHRISVLSVLTTDSKIHSATIHYAASFDPLQFIFLTDQKSKKVEPLLSGGKVAASLVIGFSEEEWLTVQMHGEVHMPTNQDEIDSAWQLYSSKYEGAEKSKANTDSTVLIFVPTWWRYSEIKSKPMVIISSEDKTI